MFPTPDPELATRFLTGEEDPRPLLVEAARLRDEGRGRTITYSRKVFIPVTTLCRDTCTYCTFVKPPGAGGEYLTPDDVMAIARAGDEMDCTEALLTLGDKPEDKWPQAEAFLSDQGCTTTIEYVAAMSDLIRSETGLFPHANPGIMSEDDIALLRPTNVSMGLMLENISDRLTDNVLGRAGRPDDIARVMLFAASDLALWVTGTTIAADAGRTAR